MHSRSNFVAYLKRQVKMLYIKKYLKLLRINQINQILLNDSFQSPIPIRRIFRLRRRRKGFFCSKAFQNEKYFDFSYIWRILSCPLMTKRSLRGCKHNHMERSLSRLASRCSETSLFFLAFFSQIVHIYNACYFLLFIS